MQDTNIVFTYKTIVNKVDQDGKTPLAGADFTLQKKTLKKGQDGNPVKDDKGNSVYEYTNVKKLTVVDAQTTRFEFSGLDDGEYRLTETTTPAGYNTIDPVEFTITATHEETSEAVPKLLTLSGGDKKTGGVTFSAGKAEDGSLDGSLTTNIVNKNKTIADYRGFVRTVGTMPSVAAIGLTEDECMKRDLKYKQELTPINMVSASNIIRSPR